MVRRLLDVDRTMRRALAVVLVALGLASGVFPYGLFRLTERATDAVDYHERSRTAASDAVLATDSWIDHVAHLAEARALRRRVTPPERDTTIVRLYTKVGDDKARLDSLQRVVGTPDYAAALALLNSHWAAIETLRDGNWRGPGLLDALDAVRKDFDLLRDRHRTESLAFMTSVRDLQRRWLLASIVLTLIVVAVAAVLFRRGLNGIRDAIDAQDEMHRQVDESQARLADAQSLAHLGSWEWDIASGTNRWSDENFRIHGYAPGAITPTYDAWQSRLHPDDRERILDAVRAALAGEAAYDVRGRVVHPDGTVRHIHMKGEVHRNPAGAPVTMTGTVLDISDFRRAEEALVAQDTRFRSLINRSTDLIMLVSSEGQFLFISPSFEKLLGHRINDWLKRPLVDLVWPSDLAQARELLDQGRVRPRDPIPYTIRVRHADGTFRWIEGTGTNFIDDPTTGGVVVNGRDVTERIEAEASLRTRDAAMRTALTGIAITDASGTIVYVNPAFVVMWGFESEANVLGRNPEVLGDPGASHDIVAAVARDGSWQGEITARRRDGSHFPAFLSVSSIRDADGRVLNMMGSFLDLTEAKRLEAQLLQTQKIESVGQLAGGIAHDFNNFLTVINGHASLALLRMPDEDPLRTRLVHIQEAAESAANVTRQLLTFARQQPASPRIITLNDVVDRLRHMLQRLLGEEVELRVRLAEEPWPILMDPGQVEQIVINLAVNGRDAMPAGGPLTIETHNLTRAVAPGPGRSDMPVGDFAALIVRDEGSGMSQDIVMRLFEPFFTTKPPGRGTGLGLATVHGVVKQHHGHIEVDTAVGFGSTFRVLFPRAEHAQPVDRTTPVNSGLPGGNELIAVVEDEDTLGEVASALLTRLGYAVRVFRNPADALETLKDPAYHVDLLFTDVVLGGMSGRVLAERLRETRPALPVLFTSGYTEDVILHHGIRTGDMAFLAKPYTFDMLARKVREALDRRA